MLTRVKDDKWAEMVTRYRKLCKSILEISDNIRYVGVMNRYGRTLTGVIKPALKPLLTPNRARDEFFIVSTFSALRKNTTGDIGALTHAVFYHKKVTILAIPQKDITFYITVNKNEKRLDEIVDSIKQEIIRE